MLFGITVVACFVFTAVVFPRFLPACARILERYAFHPKKFVVNIASLDFIFSDTLQRHFRWYNSENLSEIMLATVGVGSALVVFGELFYLPAVLLGLVCLAAFVLAWQTWLVRLKQKGSFSRFGRAVYQSFVDCRSQDTATVTVPDSTDEFLDRA